MDPRYNLTFGTPGSPVGNVAVGVNRNPRMNSPRLAVATNPTVLRVKDNSRMQQPNIYGSSGNLVPRNSVLFNPNLGPPMTNFGGNITQTNMSFGSTGGMNLAPQNNFQNIANNLNDPNDIVDKNVIYSQISRNRNNLRNNTINSSQYIALPQNDLGRNGLGTHI